jgi:hypothetical protein
MVLNNLDQVFTLNPCDGAACLKKMIAPSGAEPNREIGRGLATEHIAGFRAESGRER